jgi:hypothetical protein
MTPIEQKIAAEVVKGILAAGHTITIAYQDGNSDAIKQSTDADAILAEFHKCDEEYLLVHQAGSTRFEHLGWVQFIYGNDGHDLIANNTVGIDHLLAGAQALADRIANGEAV